jgi:hypothetical protein
VPLPKMASSPAAESPAVNVAPAVTAAPPPVVVGFRAKRPAATTSPSAASITPERMAYLVATLAKLPELDLSEMARVKSCFASVLGEGRENIVNGLELRVVLGDLGLYPSEEELHLVLRAYRDRVNLVGLARYLRLYKKEFWLNQVAARSHAQQKQLQYNTTGALPGNPASSSARKQLTAGGAGGGPSPSSLAGAPATAAARNVVPHTYTAFSGSHAQWSGAAGGGHDEDTLRVFVALGGEEDGSGEISAAALRDAVHGFGLTLDIDAAIRTVDVHHSGMLDYIDFCALWAAPADVNAVDSMGSALRQASADAELDVNAGVGGGGGPFPMTGANRRLMSVLLAPSRRSSLAAGAQQRRSYLLNSGYDTGLSQPNSPRLAGGGGGRPPTFGELQPDGTVADGHSAAAAAAALQVPVLASAVPSPITEEEHALLVRMFFFPDQLESSFSAAGAATSTDAPGRRGGGGSRFTLPSRNAQAASPSHAGQNTTLGAGGGTGGATPSGHRGSLSQKQLFRASKSNGTRGRSQTGRNGMSTRGRKGKGRAGGGGDGGAYDGDDDDKDDLAADFFSPKNPNAYRPPSPMLLSMRNSTAYRSRVKRLEEQKHAARGGGSGAGNNNSYRQQGGQYAATMGHDSYGADGDNLTRHTKSSTW